MAYNLARVFCEVEARLQADPALTLGELAADLAVNRHTIEAAVRAREGISFREWKRRIVLSQARRSLLQDTTSPIKQISQSLGYRSASAFSRFIKARSGGTPAQIRNGRIPA